jgi:hypothetical protein
MSLMDALTAGQKTQLRERKYAATQYLSMLPQTAVWTGAVLTVPSTTSFASLTASTSTGNTTNIKAGMVCRISKSSDFVHDTFFFGRARKAASGTTIYINETSDDIEVGDRIAVFDDYAVLPKLSRESGGVRLVDWDVTFRQLPPIIYDIDSIYVGFVNSSIGNTLEVAFSAGAFAATKNATISTYAWSSPDGSVVAGNITTADVTYRFPAGFRHVQLVVTDSNGLTATRQIPVLAHDTSTFLVEDGFTGAQITGTASNGWSASIEAFQGIEARYDQTQCVIWSVEYHFAGNIPTIAEEGPIITNVEFHGRLRTEDATAQADEIYLIDTVSRFNIESASAQLQRISAPILTTENDTTPTAWDQININTPWRSLVYLLAEYSTFLTSHSLSFDSVDETYIEQALTISEQDIWNAINFIMESINSRMELDQRGNSFVSRAANYLTSAERNALTVVLDDITNIDWQNLDIQDDPVQLVGFTNASGGAFNTDTDTVTPFLSLSPGSAQGTGSGIGNLPSQILTSDVDDTTAQDELNQRAGDHFAAINPNDEMSFETYEAYHIFVPSHSMYYKATVAAADTVGRQTYTTDDRWLLEEINHSFQNASMDTSDSRTVQLRFRLETQGVAGQTQPIIPAFGVDYYLPELPPFSPLSELALEPWWQGNNSVGYIPPFYQKPPSKPDLFVGPPSNGNTIVCWDRKSTSTNESDLFLSINLLGTNPSFRQISPTSAEIKDFKFKSPKNSLEAYCLTWDGINSKFWYTENFTGNPVDWTENAIDTNEWSRIVLTDEGVYIIRSEIPTGIAINESLSIPGTSNIGDQLALYTSPHVTYTLDFSNTITWEANGRQDAFYRSDDNWATQNAFRWNVGEFGGFWSSNAPLDFEFPPYNATHTYSIEIDGNNERWKWTFEDTVYGDNSGSIDVDINGDASGTGSAYSRYSSDDGGSWAAAVAIGTAPGVGSACGFDAIKIGDSAIGGGNNKARITTTEGGAYADETNTPASVFSQGIMVAIPFWQIPGAATKNINDNTPHYYIASRCVTGSGDALWKIADAAAVEINPDADATAYTANGIAVSQLSSSIVAVIMTIGITPHLYTSIDAGATWDDRGEIGLNAVSVRMRQGDLLGLQLFGAGGTNDLWYSSNFGVSIRGMNGPNHGDRAMRGIEVWG